MILERRFAGPQIIWLQAGGVSSKTNRLSFFTVLPRPDNSYVEARIPRAQSVVRGIIDRPIAENHFVQSAFGCEIGDIIVLEGGERLMARQDGGLGTTDICMLAILYQTVSGANEE
jgi:hypothetical protein